MWARITAPSGKILVELNKVTSAYVDYVSETSGTLFFTFVHLYGSGCPLYNVTYTIYTDAGNTITPAPSPSPPPPTPTPAPTPEPPPSTVDSPMWGWIIAGFIVMGILFAFAAARNKIRPRRHFPEDYEDKVAPGGDVYVHQKRRCKRCDGTGKVKRPMMGINRGGIGVQQRPMMR